MKELMIRAHKLAKELEGDYRARLKMALIIVWAEIKKGVKNIVETLEEKIKQMESKAEKALIEAMQELGYTNYDLNVWEKGEYKRLYLSLVWYSKKGKKEVKGCGYVDLKTGEYSTEHKYTKQYNIFAKEMN